MLVRLLPVSCLFVAVLSSSCGGGGAPDEGNAGEFFCGAQSEDFFMGCPGGFTQEMELTDMCIPLVSSPNLGIEILDVEFSGRLMPLSPVEATLTITATVTFTDRREVGLARAGWSCADVISDRFGPIGGPEREVADSCEPSVGELGAICACTGRLYLPTFQTRVTFGGEVFRSDSAPMGAFKDGPGCFRQDEGVLWLPLFQTFGDPVQATHLIFRR